MESKPFELGIMVGRFQTFHIGHAYMIEKALTVCREVAVFVGSSQESGTEKNPFSYEIRADILRRVFGNMIAVYPLPDIGVGNNSAWGDYVLDNVMKRCGKKPSLLVSGKESRRIDWFDSAEGVSVAELYVPKIIDISATEMRAFLINGDEARWRRYTPEPLWQMYGQLRQDVLAAQGHTETASI